ncbi:hypothetical protein T484DRAFT_1783425, partial [Baffinella frigidus]
TYTITANRNNLLASGSPVMLGPNNYVTITFPSPWTGPAHAAFEVQTAMLYSNPLPASETALRCIDESGLTSWSSEPALVPTDNKGGFEERVLRAKVPALTFRKCAMLGSATLLNLRAFGGDAIVSDLPGGAAYKIRLPFNPSLQNEVLADVFDDFTGLSSLVLADVFDDFTGLSSLVSCVYWDAGKQTWSTDGIAFVDAYYGDATGQDAWVECISSHLSLFAASE